MLTDAVAPLDETAESDAVVDITHAVKFYGEPEEN